MPLPLMVVVNQSTLITDAHAVRLMSQAVSRQIHKQAAPAWGREPCTVLALPADTPIMDDAVTLYLLDDSDQADALGYHTEDPSGRQYGRIFVKPVLDHGGSLLEGALSVSAVLSHEALEWFVDPTCQGWEGPDQQGFLYAREVGDPVESDSYEIAVGGHNVSVSNFVFPAWFDPQATPGTPLDVLGNVLTPFTMSRGGYVIKLQSGQTSAVFGADYPSWRLETKNHPAARTNRRAQPWENLTRAEPENALQEAPAAAAPPR